MLSSSSLPSINHSQVWYCHCCSARNEAKIESCKVCGRHKSYVIDYFLPLHGVGGKVVRTSQLTTYLSNPDSIHDTDRMQWTPLHSCSIAGNADVVEDLLQRESVVNANAEHGYIPLHLAAYSGSVDTILALLRYGSDINCKTETERNTPLHLAVQEGCRDAVECLINYHADVNAKNLLDRTPLHFAALNGRADIGYLLLKSGANIDSLDVHGWTPQQIADLHQHEDFIDTLFQFMSTDKNEVDNLREASWHSGIWEDVVKMKGQRKKQFQQDRLQWESTVIEANVARKKLVDDIIDKSSDPNRIAFVPVQLNSDSALRMQTLAENVRGNQTVRLGKYRKQRAPKLSAIERNDLKNLSSVGHNGATLARRLQPLSTNNTTSSSATSSVSSF